MQAARFVWVRWTALLGLIAAIVLIALGAGGPGLLLLVPLALLFDVGLLRAVRAGTRALTKRIVGNSHA
jgi:hypothetical protein